MEPHPFQGRFVIHMLGVAMIDLCTKLEISMFTHYEDMKDGQKMQKLESFGELGVTQGHRQHNHSMDI